MQDVAISLLHNIHVSAVKINPIFSFDTTENINERTYPNNIIIFEQDNIIFEQDNNNICG